MVQYCDSESKRGPGPQKHAQGVATAVNHPGPFSDLSRLICLCFSYVFLSVFIENRSHFVPGGPPFFGPFSHLVRKGSLLSSFCRLASHFGTLLVWISGLQCSGTALLRAWWRVYANTTFDVRVANPPNTKLRYSGTGTGQRANGTRTSRSSCRGFSSTS